jgi:hypothetical protein
MIGYWGGRAFFRFLLVGSSDFGTATSRRVNSVMRSNAFGSGVSAGPLGVSFMVGSFSFCRVEASAWSVRHVVAGATLPPINCS